MSDDAYGSNGYGSNRYGNDTTSRSYGNNPDAYQDYNKNEKKYEDIGNGYRQSSGKQLGVKGSLLLILIATIAAVYMLYFS